MFMDIYTPKGVLLSRNYIPHLVEEPVRISIREIDKAAVINGDETVLFLAYATSEKEVMGPLVYDEGLGFHKEVTHE